MCCRGNEQVREVNNWQREVILIVPCQKYCILSSVANLTCELTSFAIYIFLHINYMVRGGNLGNMMTPTFKDTIHP